MRLSCVFFIILGLFAFCSCPLFCQVNSGNSPLLPQKTAEVSILAANESEAPAEISWRMVVYSFMVGGLVLMLLEITVIPGFGVTGILGFILVLGSMIASYIKLPIIEAAFVVVLGIGSVAFLIYWFTNVFPNTAMGKKIILSADSSDSSESVAVENYDHMIGCEGVTTTILRPSGIAKINGERCDVITEGEYVEKGATIVVKKASAGRIIVAEKEA